MKWTIHEDTAPGHWIQPLQLVVAVESYDIDDDSIENQDECVQIDSCLVKNRTPIEKINSINIETKSKVKETDPSHRMSTETVESELKETRSAQRQGETALIETGKEKKIDSHETSSKKGPLKRNKSVQTKREQQHSSLHEPSQQKKDGNEMNKIYLHPNVDQIKHSKIDIYLN